MHNIFYDFAIKLPDDVIYKSFSGDNKEEDFENLGFYTEDEIEQIEGRITGFAAG